MIKLGTNSIGKLYLGTNQIGTAYLGSNLVYQSGSSPTPPTPPTPTGLVFYDRLVFDGTAYIDTDITPPANASFRTYLGNETLKAGQRLFLCNATTGLIGALLSPTSTTSTTRQFSVYYGASSAVTTSVTLPFSTTDYYLVLTPKRFIAAPNSSNTGTTFSKGNGTPSSALVIGANVNHNGQPFTGRMSIFRIYDSDAQNATSASELLNYTPAYTLRPCTYNGEAGLWCVETETFYGNTAESGELTVLNI